jgi:hypothetical protein
MTREEKLNVYGQGYKETQNDRIERYVDDILLISSYIHSFRLKYTVKHPRTVKGMKRQRTRSECPSTPTSSIAFTFLDYMLLRD